MKLSLVLLALIVILILPGCTNGPVEPVDITINIVSPEEGAMFEHGDQVHIDATIKGPSMHGYELYIRNKSVGDSVVFSKMHHSHASSYSIHEYWPNNVTQHGDMELEIRVAKDHDGETKVKKVTFYCKPV